MEAERDANAELEGATRRHAGSVPPRSAAPVGAAPAGTDPAARAPVLGSQGATATCFAEKLACFGEIVGGFDADGVYLGPVERPVVARPEESGVYGQAGLVFFVRGERLAVAVRSRHKTSWPRGLDFTAAGVSAPGETELETALREAREETGVDLDPELLRKVCSWLPREGYCSRATLWTYPWGESPIPFNREDIEEILWLTFDELLTKELTGREMKTDLRRFLAWPLARRALEEAHLAAC